MKRGLDRASANGRSKSRGRAPKGERAALSARRIRRCGPGFAPFGALPPLIFLEANVGLAWDWLAQNSDADASRERDRFSFRPRDSGGGWCERSRSRDAPAPEFCRPKPRSFCLQKIRGGGAPKMRNCPVGPRHAADVAIRLRFGRGRAFSGTRSPFGAPPRFLLRPCAEVRSRPRFTRCSAKELPPPWHRA